MKKWDRKYMSLEHPVVPESKGVLKQANNKNKDKKRQNGTIWKHTQ